MWSRLNLLEDPYRHTVLDRQRGFNVLRRDVREWLDENCQAGWMFGSDLVDLYLRFESKRDAALFVLRWSP